MSPHAPAQHSYDSALSEVATDVRHVASHDATDPARPPAGTMIEKEQISRTHLFGCLIQEPTAHLRRERDSCGIHAGSLLSFKNKNTTSRTNVLSSSSAG